MIKQERLIVFLVSFPFAAVFKSVIISRFEFFEWNYFHYVFIKSTLIRHEIIACVISLVQSAERTERLQFANPAKYCTVPNKERTPTSLLFLLYLVEYWPYKVFFGGGDIPLCLNNSTKIKLCMYSVQHNNIYFIYLMWFWSCVVVNIWK